MATLQLYNVKTSTTSEVILDDSVFGVPIHNQAIYNVVNAQLAAQRHGTHDTKTRTEVSGGGKKPWKQKGTGHARQGSIRSPQWVGGGVVFGPHPRKYEHKVNKKVRKLAFNGALSSHLSNSTLIIVDDLYVSEAKTKHVAKLLLDLKIDGRVLFLSDEFSNEFVLAARNISSVYLTTTTHASTYEILHAKFLVLTKSALDTLQKTKELSLGEDNE
jgi:large subunit ribosomal protein L4